jgi:predicted Zn-dependent protease
MGKNGVQMCIRILSLTLLISVSSIGSRAEKPAGENQRSSPAPHEAVQSRRQAMRNIDAIGRRNVGCNRGIGNWYSLDRQIAMGKENSTRVEATAKLVEDPEVTKYIDSIGQNLVRNSDAQVPFTIKVIDSGDLNAITLPGGFVYIDTGLILAAETEAELAGVMAHEIAHAAACHAARGRTRAQLASLASFSMTMVGGPIAYAAYQSMAIVKPLTFLKFSRTFESEADFLAIQYMYRAGYDPLALTTFFERVKAMESGNPKAIARLFQTHPQTGDRIRRTQAEIDTLLPPKVAYKVDTSEFEAVKERLFRLQNRIGIQNANHPSLRRAPVEGDFRFAN